MKYALCIYRMAGTNVRNLSPSRRRTLAEARARRQSRITFRDRGRSLISARGFFPPRIIYRRCATASREPTSRPRASSSSTYDRDITESFRSSREGRGEEAGRDFRTAERVIRMQKASLSHDKRGTVWKLLEDRRTAHDPITALPLSCLSAVSPVTSCRSAAAELSLYLVRDPIPERNYPYDRSSVTRLSGLLAPGFASSLGDASPRQRSRVQGTAPRVQSLRVADWSGVRCDFDRSSSGTSPCPRPRPRPRVAMNRSRLLDCAGWCRRLFVERHPTPLIGRARCLCHQLMISYTV